MRSYRLNQGAWPGLLGEKVRPNVMRLVIGTYVVVACASIALAVSGAMAARVAGGVVGIAAIFLCFLWLHRNIWRSFEIVVDEERVVQRAAYSSRVELARDEIAEVSEASGGALVVRSSRGNRPMIVPKYLDGLAELRSTLERWASDARGRRTSG